MIQGYTFSENAFIDAEMRKDFEQEILLLLLEYADKKAIRRMFKRQQLRYFIVGIIKRQYQQFRSNYNTKYAEWEKRRRSLSEADL